MKGTIPGKSSGARIAIVITCSVALCTNVSGCGKQTGEPVLVHPSGLYGPDLSMEQSLSAEFEAGRILARAVVVKREDELRVVILTPTGQRMFYVIQRGAKIRDWNGTGLLAQTNPLFLLRDVRWMFFERCVPPAGSSVAECRKGVETFRESGVGPAHVGIKIESRGTVAIVNRMGQVRCGGFTVPESVVLKNQTAGYVIQARVDRCNPVSSSP